MYPTCRPSTTPHIHASPHHTRWKVNDSTHILGPTKPKTQLVSNYMCDLSTPSESEWEWELGQIRTTECEDEGMRSKVWVSNLNSNSGSYSCSCSVSGISRRMWTTICHVRVGGEEGVGMRCG